MVVRAKGHVSDKTSCYKPTHDGLDSDTCGPNQAVARPGRVSDTLLIGGVDSDEPLSEHMGSVYGDTMRWREYGLPAHLVVILSHDDEECDCLDVSAMKGEACPVVDYERTARDVVGTMADDFLEYLEDYVEGFTGEHDEDDD